MAPDKKEKKRKAATAAAAADPPTKKSKSEPKASKKNATSAESNSSAPKSALPKTNGESARQLKPRKRAADFLSDKEDSGNEVAPATAAGAKVNGKKAKKANEPQDIEENQDEPQPEVEKKSKKAKKSEPEAQPVENDSDPDVAGEEGENDQTAALLKGFESSGDEDASEDEGYTPGQPVPTIPDSKKVKRKLQKKKKESDSTEDLGTVYVGRIPHGFYEHEMRAYFSQFGTITRLRLSRNRVTGRSKHYAFIEFSSASVAKVVADTMDNYLMFGHILKCKVVPQERVHPELWKGANRRFKRTPWNKLEQKRLEEGKSRDKWTEKVKEEQRKRNAKAEKLKALGYEFEMPTLKSVAEVPIKEKPVALPEPAEPASEETKAIEAPAEEPKAEESVESTPKASKRAKGKRKSDGPVEAETPVSTKKVKKDTPKKDTPKKDTPKKDTPKKAKSKTKA